MATFEYDESELPEVKADAKYGSQVVDVGHWSFYPEEPDTLEDIRRDIMAQLAYYYWRMDQAEKTYVNAMKGKIL